MKRLLPSLAKLRQRVATSVVNRQILTLILFGMLAVSANAQTIRYVNGAATSFGDGTSWATAYKSLQSALDVAVSGDEIWVAMGTYKPSKEIGTATGDPRRRNFLLKDGIKLYGGFAGSESSLSARNILANKTILSGDLSGNDGAGFTGNGENCFHVVATTGLTTATILDGFTISGGNANYTFDSDPFLGASSGNTMGSGLFISNAGAHLNVSNCTFTNNSTQYSDGSVYIHTSSPTITNCVIVSNKSSGLTSWNSSFTITNSVIANNTSFRGAGIWCNAFSTSTAIVANCTIYGNSASSEGGGVLAWNSAGIRIRNSIVWGNTAPTEAKAGVVASNPTVQIIYSNIQGGFAGTGNINEDPYFNKIADLDGADNNWGTADDGLALVYNSPSANTGNNADIPAGITTDIAGSARIQDVTVNMGAYETLIMKTAQTIDFDAVGSKTYGDAPFTLNATASSGLPVVYSLVSGPATISGNTVTITGKGSVMVKAFQSGDDTYAPIKSEQTVTINAKDITVTADAQTKEYSSSDPVLSYSITSGSLVGSDVFTGVLNRVTGEDVGTYAINKNTLALSSNYNLTFVSKDLTITKKAITVTANAQTKVYGEADPTLTYTITSGTLKSGDAFTGSLNRAAGEVVGAYAINQNTLALNSNYSLTYVGADLIIDKRAITITANDATKVEGQVKAFAGTEYSITTGSLASSDVISSVSLNSTGAAASATAGTYDIVPSAVAGISTTNYNITYVNGTLTVAPCVTTAISTQPDPETVCVGGTASFDVVATGSNLKYQWYKGATTISGANTATLTIPGVTTASAGDYKVVVTGDCGVETSSSVALTIWETTTITTNPSSQVVCEGGSVTFTGAASGTGVSYKWLKDGSPLSGSGSAYTIATVTAAHVGEYKLEATSACGVATSTGATLTVNPIPATPTITASGATTFCDGGSVTLTSSATSGNQWYKDGASITGATGQTYTATASGSYKVIVTQSSCVSPESAATAVTVNPAPATPVISATGNILSSSVATGNQWYLNGTAIAGATGQTHRVQASGLYTVKATLGSCEAISVAYNFVATRIDNPSTWNGEVSIYPNPVVKTLVVKNAAGRKLQVQLCDNFGKKVYETKVLGAQGHIDVQSLSSGIYQVVITDVAKNETITQTIIKL